MVDSKPSILCWALMSAFILVTTVSARIEDTFKRLIEKEKQLTFTRLFVCFLECPEHCGTWCRCDLPTAVSKLSFDDLQIALHFQTKRRWTVGCYRQEGNHVSNGALLMICIAFTDFTVQRKFSLPIIVCWITGYNTYYINHVPWYLALPCAPMHIPQSSKENVKGKSPFASKVSGFRLV